MPTKTRLDPTAGGETPPAGQDGAQGSGHGGNSTSVAHAAPGSADVAGFMDSLAALSAHITAREAFEADVRRGWSRMAGACGVLLGVQVIAGYLVIGAGSWGQRAGLPASVVALYVVGPGTSALAALLFSAAAASPWRAAADHVDRVALRHEDSPLRDRIRITQWMLFDSALSRFSANERRVNAVIAHGVMLVSVMATLSLALTPPLRETFGAGTQADYRAAAAAMAVFLILTIITIAATMRSGKQSHATAQHYARQVLALDEDFGGFLPRAEKDHVTKFAAATGAGAEDT